MPRRRDAEAKKKKPNDQLRSVVEETAIPATVGLLKDNERFVFPSGTTWALLMLEVESIGGLSKRDRNNDSKGQLIELIRSDQIHVVATDQMLEAEILGLIPDRATMERLDEYSMMTSVLYSWGIAWYQGNDLVIEQSDETVSFSTVRDVSLGNTTLREAVGEKLWKDFSGQSAQAAADSQDQQVEADADGVVIDDADEVQDTEDVDEDTPVFEQGVVSDEEDEPTYGEADDDEPVLEDEVDESETTQVVPAQSLDEQAEDETDEDSGISLPAEDLSLEQHEDADENGAGFEDFVLQDDKAEAEEEEYELPEGQSFEQLQQMPSLPVETFEDHRQVQEAIARRFLSGDLDLDVDLNSFNATFGISAPVVQIEVPTGSSQWLTDQIAQLTQQANAALFQLHHSNQDRMRASYVNLASHHAQNIEKSVSLDQPDSRYGKLKAQAEASRQEDLNEKDRRVRTARNEVAEQYQRQADEAGEAAQRTARASYLERHRSRMEREQADRAAEIESSIEATYSANLDRINGLRRQAASLKMEKGQTAIFEALAEKQQADHESERRLLAEWSEYISSFVDDHRKADLARAEALADHDRRNDELAAAQRDHEALVSSIRAEHEQQLERSRAESEAAEKAIRAQLERVDSDWQHELELKNAQLISVEKQAAELREKNASIEAEADARYKTQIEQIRDDRDAAQRGNAQITDMQRRSNSMLIVLIVVLGILAFLAGGIFFSTILGG